MNVNEKIVQGNSDEGENSDVLIASTSATTNTWVIGKREPSNLTFSRNLFTSLNEWCESVKLEEIKIICPRLVSYSLSHELNYVIMSIIHVIIIILMSIDITQFD